MACSFIDRFSHKCHKYGTPLFRGLSLASPAQEKPLEIDVANHAIYHYPEVAWMPNYAGTKQERPYKFDGELLTFSVKATNRSGVESRAITWRKMK
jgi:hypothetical protein